MVSKIITETTKKIFKYLAKGSAMVTIRTGTCRDFKVGDRVRITREAKYNEKGWKNVWVPLMNSKIGQIMIIKRIEAPYGIYFGDVVYPDGNLYNFEYPWFVLELVK